MLADKRRRPKDRAGRVGEIDECAEGIESPDDRVLLGGDKPEAMHLGIVEDLLLEFRRRDLTGNPARVQRFEPRARVVVSETTLEDVK